MSSQTIYLVTGAARGVGLALVTRLATDAHNIVFAGVRDTNLGPDHPLAKLASDHPEAVQLIKISSANKENNTAAAEVIKDKYGKVDVIIANAGVSSGAQPLRTVTSETVLGDFTTNTIGPLILFQSFVSLLESSEVAKFVIISSLLGQITESLNWPHNAYGLSKAGANFIAKKINQEEDHVVSFPIHPGLVATDMARAVADGMGAKVEDLGAISPEDSAAGVLTVVNAATKETHGGKFWSYDGSALTY